MSGIDWSKAPPWADCVIKSNDCGDELYWAEPWGTSNGKRCRLGYEDKKVESWHIADTTIKGRAWILIESRPAKAWSGEGLPPVGTECEYGSDDRCWIPVKVIAHQVGGIYLVPQAVSQVTEHGQLCIGQAQYFRPIRTPEQIAAEEREKSIDEMAKVLEDKLGRSLDLERELCEWLYDANYRKQAKP